MKLIDILVQELPKRGGWPKGCAEITQDADGCLCIWKLHGARCDSGYWSHRSGVGLHQYWSGIHAMPGSEDGRESIITKDKYETALAASKPEWDGDGLPPVGCRVEANYGGEWVEATVAYTERPEAHGDAVAWKEALVFDCKTTRPFWADEFRPIRSEADKKREEAINKIQSHAHVNFTPPISAGQAIALYDAIAAGKIPHIRID